MRLTEPELADRWRAARAPADVVHLDSAAAARSSRAVVAAVTAHLQLEARIGGYVAAELAQPAIDELRGGLGALLGRAPGDVAFTESAAASLRALLDAWPLSAGARVLVSAGEYGPNLASFIHRGLDVRVAAAVDEVGHLDPATFAGELDRHRPDLVHLCAIGAHRGVVQPLAALVEACHAAGVAVVVDAAQAVGHLDCRVGADAIYGTSRKWLAGPRGVGFLAVRPDLAARLRPAGTDARPAGGDTGPSSIAALESSEAFVAGRVGLAVAVAEHLAAGPDRIRASLAAIGAHTRAVLHGVGGWSVVEPEREPSAITTLRPPTGRDDDRVAAARRALLDRHHILLTYAGPQRAPRQVSRATLRISPHVDVTTEQIDALARALPHC